MLPLISIIVPIYNIEQYLRRCIESILLQTYHEFELLLIDDGSTDESGCICDEYVRKDYRVKTFHKPNGGVSSARNFGVLKSSGDWICFIDSDDWIDVDFLDNYIQHIKNNCDLYIQGFYSNYPDKEIKTVFAPAFYSHNYQVVEYLENTKGVHNGFLWHRLFKSEIIKSYQITFVNGLSFAEDGLFFLEYMRYVRNTMILPELGYHYFRNSNGLTKKGKHIDVHILKQTFCEYMKKLKDIGNTNERKNYEYEMFIQKYGSRLIINWFLRRAIINNDIEIFNVAEECIEEFSLYVNPNADICSKLLMKAGIRTSSFNRLIGIPFLCKLKTVLDKYC